MWANVAAVILSLIAFLSGLSMMRRGLEQLSGSKLHHLMHMLVRTPTRGLVTGAVLTAAVQSSAAITAITVGMVASGSIAFREAIGVILGSNVGATMTPQLLTLNLTAIAIPCLLIGVTGYLVRKPRYRNISMALTGFACIVIALAALKVALHPLTTQPWLKASLAHAGLNPLAAITAGCLASAAIQSSTATTVITMALADTAVIPLQGAIAIVLGANIGTCLTSVIAAIGRGRAAEQVALSHVFLNVGGVALFFPFLPAFTTLMAHLANTPAQQIANAHTLFNIVCTLLVWPFSTSFARFIEYVLPDNRNA